MSKLIDLTGQKFGRLTVIERTENHTQPNGKSKPRWRCICDCGNETITEGYSLTHGLCKSCGCARKDAARANKFEDLTGQKFGRLTVIQYLGSTKSRNSLWVCECSCQEHNHVIIQSGNLKSGNTTSCGCVHKENAAKLLTKHGEKHSKIYGVWCTMKSRCQNPNNKNYHNYGGRGILLCEDWQDFQKFFAWTKESGYEEGLSIDRINVNGNYEPQNCRWATPKVQANNTRTNKFYEYKGETHTIAEWKDMTGKPISQRLSDGWTIEDAIEREWHDNYRQYIFKNETHTIADWSKITGIKYWTLYNRLVLLHWEVERALTTIKD